MPFSLTQLQVLGCPGSHGTAADVQELPKLLSFSTSLSILFLEPITAIAHKSARII